MKIRNGFVSNSSSSSFTAFTTVEEYDKMEFTPSERAVIDIIGLGSHMLGDLSLVEFSYMSGERNDTEWIKMDDFAQKVIEYAKESTDLSLSEYEEQYEIACETIEKSVEKHVQNYSFMPISRDEWEYFMDLFSDAQYSIAKKFKSLNESGLCIIHEMDF